MLTDERMIILLKDFLYVIVILLIIVYLMIIDIPPIFVYLILAIFTIIGVSALIFAIVHKYPNIVYLKVITATVLYTSLFLSLVIFSDRRLSRFFSILIMTIILRVINITFNIKTYNIGLNFFRFAMIILSVLSKYGNLNLPDFEYADKAIIASIVFDSIFSSQVFDKIRSLLKEGEKLYRGN